MSSLTPAVLFIDPDSRYAYDDVEALLAGSTEQLAHLRFTIILVARWVSSRSVTPQRRKELRTELARLRGLYLGMVDELAMAYGAHQALMTRNYVERTVSVCFISGNIGKRAAPKRPASLPISAMVTTVCFCPGCTRSGAVSE